MQEKNLNIIPSGDMPVIYASQYDNNRVIRFNLFDGEDEYTLSGTETVKCNIRKNDEHIVVIVPTIGANKYIDVYLTEQACACFGDNIGEITISSGEDNIIGTINFILKVERNPIQGGVTSASDIADLESQIEDIVHEVMTDDYYTRDEVDAKLDLKANASDVYTKSQVDTALGLKADKADTYTKSQVDTALASKADASSVYTKSEVDTALALKANASDVYTKTEVDEIIDDLYPVNTASGSIATFTTSLVRPLTELTSTIVAQQASGTPTPSSPLPISGFSSVNVTRTGKNLLNNDTSAFDMVSQNYLQAKMPSVPKIISLTDNDTSVALTGVYFGAFKEYADSSEGFVWLVNNGTISRRSFDITDYDYITVYPKTALQTVFDRFFVQVEKGTTATAYEPYNPQSETKTIALGQTVYGGVLDVINGKLRVTQAIKTFDGSENWVLYASGTNNNVFSLSDAVTDILDENGQYANMFNYNQYAFSPIDDYVNTFVLGSSKRLFCQVAKSMAIDATAFKALLSNTNLQVIYNITPVEIDITANNFTTINGEQNNFSDCGEVSVSFKQGIQEYIDAKIAETQALIL